MKTHLLKQLLIILCLILCIGAFIVFLTRTEAGCKFVFYVASKVVPGKLEVTLIEGKFSGTIHLTNLHYKTSTVELYAEKIQLESKLEALFYGKIKLQKFYADNIKLITTKAKTQQQTSFVFHSRLNQLQFGDIRLSHILWQHAQYKPIRIDNITLQINLLGNNLAKLKAELHAPAATIAIAGEIQKEWRLHWLAKINKLEELIPDSSGSFISSGQVFGPRAMPELQATLQMKNLHYQNSSLEQLQSELKVAFNAKEKSRLSLVIRALKINDFALSKLALNAGLWQQVPGNQQLKIHLAPFVLTLPQKAAINSIKISATDVTSVINKLGLEAEANIFLSDNNPIKLTLNLPKYRPLTIPSASQPINGTFNWQVQDFAKFNLLPKQLNDLHGQMQIIGDLAGTFNKAKINVALNLKNFSAKVPALNLVLQQGIFSAKTTGNQIEFKGEVSSANGKLTLSGNTSLANNVSAIKISGENFLAINTNEYHVTASPELNLQIKNNKVFLRGAIFIPSAAIKPNFNANTVDLPQEVEFVKATPEQTTFPDIDANVVLQLGDEVKFDVMGLSGNITGKLQVNEEAKKLTTAVGILRMQNAIYNIYGQKLHVTEGSLHFTGGAITNPEVSIRAVRDFKAENVFSPWSTSEQELKVGMRMSGILDNMQVDLFSEPAGLSNPDILSYLIVGRPTSEVTGASAQILLRAANALNFSGSGKINKVVESLQNQFGLSEFGLASETRTVRPTEIKPNKYSIQNKPGESLVTNTAFVIGKYLTPKIYIGYSMGLFDPVSIFRVRYLLNRHWSVQSESSSLGNGADVLYTIERD